ncbi:MAG TPA: helix-turn-helix transcriptional regulator [Burkholderiaceae bacterium]|nr:helix-turn-helix transcriptional regulator [Burkholderiaceae bacterium]
MKDELRHMTFGQRLRHYRIKAGYTVAREFAPLIGIKPPSLSELETNESKGPAPATLLRAARVLGLDPWHLLTGEGAPVVAFQQLSLDEIRLLMLYRGLSNDGQHRAEIEVNALYVQEHPARSSANPFPDPKRRLKQGRSGR